MREGAKSSRGARGNEERYERGDEVLCKESGLLALRAAYPTSSTEDNIRQERISYEDSSRLPR